MQKLTIGMPVYNGASTIRFALDSLLTQTYSEFVLIISDNASMDNTESICLEYQLKDQRVRYVRNLENIGPHHNFCKVLDEAETEFFMWAAHDDHWAKDYIESIMECFKQCSSSIAAINTEAIYTINKSEKKFFAEGKAFYDFEIGDPILRVKHILKNNYGNLFYSIYRREYLYNKKAQSILSNLKCYSQNEIPLFLEVALRGNFKVIPEPKFYKETNIETYKIAKWEINGGLLPVTSLKKYFKCIFLGAIYHFKTLFDLIISILNLNIITKYKIYLISNCFQNILFHYFSMVCIFKKK